MASNMGVNYTVHFENVFLRSTSGDYGRRKTLGSSNPGPQVDGPEDPLSNYTDRGSLRLRITPIFLFNLSYLS